MSNRAVITTPEKKIGIYLPWNGDRERVESFLDKCKKNGYRPPERDIYGWTCLIQVITHFGINGLSIGIGMYEELDRDNGDNGVYIIKDWEIIGREYAPEFTAGTISHQSKKEHKSTCGIR